MGDSSQRKYLSEYLGRRVHFAQELKHDEQFINTYLEIAIDALEKPEHPTTLDIYTGGVIEPFRMAEHGYDITVLNSPYSYNREHMCKVFSDMNLPATMVDASFTDAKLSAYDLVYAGFGPLLADEPTIVKLFSLVKPGGYLFFMQSLSHRLLYRA